MCRMILRAITSDPTVVDLQFGGFTTTPNTQYGSGKKDFCGYHHSNYFTILGPKMGIFSKICNRN